jgi:hypothetical protein
MIVGNREAGGRERLDGWGWGASLIICMVHMAMHAHSCVLGAGYPYTHSRTHHPPLILHVLPWLPCCSTQAAGGAEAAPAGQRGCVVGWVF